MPFQELNIIHRKVKKGEKCGELSVGSDGHCFADVHIGTVKFLPVRPIV